MIPRAKQTTCRSAVRISTPCVALVLNLFMSAATAQNLVQNGSFEQVTYNPLRVNPWVAVSWQALLLNWDNAPDGVNYILVSTIYQDLNTLPGQAYTLSFDVAADLYSEPSAHVDVLWGGQTLTQVVTQPHAYDPQQNRYEQAVWELFSMPLSASAPTTRLEFQSANGVAYLFDNVRVTVVPEPPCVSLLIVVGLLLFARAVRRKSGANEQR